jgi:DNA-binding transcriptional MerR regulator
VERKKSPTASAQQKLYRSIREVSDLLEVKPHVLRYWETQFPALRPKKNRAGNRIYRPSEVDMLGRIKVLLYEQRFTIEGARRHLEEERKQPASPVEDSAFAEAPAPVSVDAAVGVAGGDNADALAAASAEIAGLRAALVEAERALEEARSQLAVRATRDLDRLEAMAELRREMESALRELRGESLMEETTLPVVDTHDAPVSAITNEQEQSEKTPSIAGETLLPAPGFA